MMIVPTISRPEATPAQIALFDQMQSQSEQHFTFQSERAQLRLQLLVRRQSIAREERNARDARLVDELYLWLQTHYPADATLALYVAFKSEPNLMALAQRWITGGGRVVLPVITEKKTSLKFAPFTSENEMVAGAYGILEPVYGDEDLLITPEQIHVVVVPCVGFNRSGFRLGYGGGYYDRTFAQWKTLGYRLPTLVGVADKESQLEFQAGAHDVPMNLICAV